MKVAALNDCTSELSLSKSLSAFELTENRRQAIVGIVDGGTMPDELREARKNRSHQVLRCAGWPDCYRFFARARIAAPAAPHPWRSSDVIFPRGLRRFSDWPQRCITVLPNEKARNLTEKPLVI